MFAWINVCGICRPEQHLECILMFHKPFPNKFHCVAWHIILLKEATSIREYFCHKGMYLVGTNVDIGGGHQSMVHMNKWLEFLSRTLPKASHSLHPAFFFVHNASRSHIISPDKWCTHTAGYQHDAGENKTKQTKYPSTPPRSSYNGSYVYYRCHWWWTEVSIGAQNGLQLHHPIFSRVQYTMWEWCHHSVLCTQHVMGHYTIIQH